jgi:hypothetical protein
MLVKINIVVCSNKTESRIHPRKAAPSLKPYPSMEVQARRSAAPWHASQAHACGDYDDDAEALNSVAIRPMRAGIRMALLEAPGRVYKRRCTAACRKTSKTSETSETSENKKTSGRKASHRARVASRREFLFLFHCIIHSHRVRLL